ncbi:MAG: glycosyltransferase [Leptolyngbyaceae cyanobacterium bins.302]|nr:glycosyltransferase [Leptolyngbyaceae cyanobacterium bins.302]
MMLGEFGLGVALLSDAIWVGLLTLWGGFWTCDQRLEEGKGARRKASGIRHQELGIRSPESGVRSQELSIHSPTHPLIHSSTHPFPNPQPLTPNSNLPFVCAVIPARNEADMIPHALRSLLQQDYPGQFQIVLVDDQSTDGTGDVAQKTAAELGKTEQLTVIQAEPLPAGWTGKLWAMEQGDRYTQTLSPQPEYLLFTDADIEHDRGNLSQLVAKATQDKLELISLMVLLRCQSFWEKLLIPAFVFFFQKLYPFPLVNNPNSKIAAAAGGCILIRHDALAKIGGLQILRQALIDDCSLAKAVKGTTPTSHGIWLGLTQTTRSLRPYDSLQTIWDMVARTAYTQLNYSPSLLVGTVFGMTLVYLVSPIATFTGLFTANWMLGLAGLAGWALMTLAYLPTIRLYRLSPLWAVNLPAIALLYNLMMIDSAIRHWRGKGGSWKGRVYSQD